MLQIYIILFLFHKFFRKKNGFLTFQRTDTTKKHPILPPGKRVDFKTRKERTALYMTRLTRTTPQ
ncbi:hypothetical protein D7D25_04875 [Proteiniphilum sp. X52]|nr:hypothetical protein D7D25_04875 [Proteiniphilum sp. X52]